MPVTFVDDHLHLRAVLDAIPSFVFVVDTDLRIIDANNQAKELLGPDSNYILKRLCGEVLHCIHELESKEQCGKTKYCGDCILRQAINSAKHDKSVFRKKYKMTLELKGKTSEIDMLVTASPIIHNGHDLFIMVLEDISELTALRILATMCVNCKKVRNDEGKWEKIHDFLARKENIMFSHGFCPDCGLELYPDLFKDSP